VQVQSPHKAPDLYGELESRIRGGEWAVGDLLPREIELAAHYKCGRHAVSQAIARLAHEGLVERRKRAGTRVLRLNREPQRASVELDAFAFIYPSEKHEGIWRTVKGFQDAAQEKGRRVVMLSSGADFRKEIEFVSRLAEFEVRGAVIYPLLLTAEEQIRFSQILLDVTFPLVLAEVNLLGLDRPSVILDGFHAGYAMARHLLGRGCRQLGFFANYARNPSVRDRFLGFRAALEEAGQPLDPSRIFLETAMHPDFGDPLLESADLARRFLRQTRQVDGVVCVNDFLATGLIRAAEEIGLRVPADLKITGMEDFAFPHQTGPALTTYRVPFEQMGRTAFSTLESLSLGQLPPSQETQIRGQLIIREST